MQPSNDELTNTGLEFEQSLHDKDYPSALIALMDQYESKTRGISDDATLRTISLAFYNSATRLMISLDQQFPKLSLKVDHMFIMDKNGITAYFKDPKDKEGKFKQTGSTVLMKSKSDLTGDNHFGVSRETLIMNMQRLILQRPKDGKKQQLVLSRTPNVPFYPNGIDSGGLLKFV